LITLLKEKSDDLSKKPSNNINENNETKEAEGNEANKNFIKVKKGS